MDRKHQHLSLIATSVLLLVLVLLAFWQTSLNFGEFRPSGPVETLILWAISTLVVLGVFTLGFIVLRSLLKLYVEQQENRPGSKIKTKLIGGALVLSLVPVVSMVLFSFTFLNRTLDKWFTYPAEEVLANAAAAMSRLSEVMRERIEKDASWIASMHEVVSALQKGGSVESIRGRLQELTDGVSVSYIALLPPAGRVPLIEVRSGDAIQGPVEWRLPAETSGPPEPVISGIDREIAYASTPVREGAEILGRVVVAWQVPRDIVARRAEMQRLSATYLTLRGEHRHFRYFYSGIIALISVFVLFVAMWLAQYLSKRIVVPIEALLHATSELSRGRLDYRVETQAIDEFAALVESFNHMTRQLESKTRQLQASNAELARANVELEERRRFIDTLLDSITPGVISVSASGTILKVNSSLSSIFGRSRVKSAEKLQDLFPLEDFEDVLYMMKRARRTGLASREFEMKQRGQIMHLAVTVSALDKEDEDRGSEPPRFVVVLEDMSDLLRAQKSAAWTEVARRVAHEIKNPLTPIALSAERMSRLLDRIGSTSDAAERDELRRRFDRCTDTIVREVESLRTLVDEFSQFARFPTAQPERTDLNEVVSASLDVFQGRLDGVKIRKELAAGLPPVYADPGQFKRVIVNLIDNAAEALQDSWVKEILISTAPGPLPESVELVVADSGNGISAEDKEKLFLPYFSTKKRGTGLGLAIVNRVLTEHRATIRVEDNRPSGSRFIIEIPTAETEAPVAAGVQA